MDSTTSLVAAIAAMIGSAVPVIAKTLFEFFTSKQKTAADMLRQQFDDLRKERQDNVDRASAITTDLQKQIFELRQQVIGLQQDNFKYVQENAELKAKVIILTKENDELKIKVGDLNHEMRAIRNDTHNASTAHGTTH